MKILLKIFLLLIIFQISAVYGVEEKTTLRVGISNNSFSTYEHSAASFMSGDNLSVIDMSTGDKTDVDAYSSIDARMTNGLFFINIDNKNIIKEAKGPVVISGPSKIGIINLKRKGTPAYYLGMIELKQVNEDKFNIINVLAMQDYLKGVIPNEMPVSFGFEALKAQAVAARNYANRPNDVYKNYDVCDSTACQVYYGANSQTPISDKAVDETEGIYALYDNELILALYSSTPSGITENYFDTFGNGIENKPYLTSVQDNKSLKQIKDKDKIEEYFKEKIPSFDMNSPRYRWEVKFDRFELEDIISKTLAEQSKTGAVSPAFTGKDEFFGLEDIKVLRRGASYKALEIEIKSVSGDYIIKKELPIRKVFKKDDRILSSANFSVEKIYDDKDIEKIKEKIKGAKKAAKISEDNEEIIFKTEEEMIPAESEDLEQTNVSRNDNKNKRIYKTKFGRNLPSAFVFYGAGFGHGVGLSQYGAGFLSSYGVGYENILKHYYKGITIGTLKKNVSYNSANINYIQEFYFKKKNNSKGSFLNPSKSPLKKEINELLDDKKPKCFLTIENQDKVSRIEFFINNYYFCPDTSLFKKKVLKTDITNFLAEGKNKVVFKPLSENDRKKTVKFYLTFGECDE